MTEDQIHDLRLAADYAHAATQKLIDFVSALPEHPNTARMLAEVEKMIERLERIEQSCASAGVR